jgi:hypothetical protein
MNFIEKFSSLYRAYFKYHKSHQHKLDSQIIKQLILATTMLVGISVVIGLLTHQISSFLYVYLSFNIITLMMSYFYVYFAYQESKRISQYIHLFPWLKWVNMFFLYQLLILSIFYIQLVPIIFIFVISIYTLISIVFFNFVETVLEIDFSTIISSIKTALLLFIGHSAFLYILPISHIVLSFVCVIICISLSLLVKTYLEKSTLISQQLNHRNQIGILLFIISSVSYIVIQRIPKQFVDDAFIYFSHQEIFRDQVNIKHQHTFDDEEILQLITDDTHIYVRTNQYIHVLNHDLSVVESVSYTGMSLVETNQGVKLIEYHQPSEYPIYDGFPFSLYSMTADDQWIPYLTFYIDVDQPIHYIYFNQRELFFFTPFWNNGEIRYFDGDVFINSGTYIPRIIENDDVYIEFTESYRFGLHRVYGDHTIYRSNIDGSIQQFREWISPQIYGYHHILYFSYSNQYYHSTSKSLVDTSDIKGFRNPIYLQPDGSIFSIEFDNIYHYDSNFNLISSFYLKGELILTENEFIFYVQGSSIYQVDVNDLGSYQVILNRDVRDHMMMIALLMLFIFWQSYRMKPDEY